MTKREAPTISPTLGRLGRFTLYRKALRCAELVLGLRVTGNLRDQMQRAMRSVVLNIAEGAGERGSTAQKRYYSIARGSVSEVAAAIDLYRIEGGRSTITDEIVGLVRETDAILASLTHRH